MADQNLSIEISARDLTGPAFASVARNIEDMAGASKETARGVAELGASADRAAGFIKGAGLVGAVLMAANELSKYHAETRKSVAALADQADQLNLTTNRWQALVFAGDQVGVSQEKLAGVMSRFSTRIGEAAGGSKSAIESFDKLGVKLLDNTGKLRGQDQILQEVAQGILRMSNADEQAAAAKDLLGISGARMVPLLRQLADGMGEVERRAQAAGVVIDKDVVAAANRLENQSHATKMAIRKFYAEIGLPIEVGFLRLVEQTVGGIADAYARAQREEKAWRASAGERAAQGDMSVLKDQLAVAEQQLATNPNNKMAQASVDALKKRIAAQQPALTQAMIARGQEDVNAADMQRLLYDGLPATGGGETQSKTKSTGGGSSRDRIQEGLNQIIDERRAAERALAQFMAGTGVPLKELERQVALEKKIADEIAKLGKFDPNDPRVQRIREEITAREQAEAAWKKEIAAARDAEQVERTLGNGKAYLRDETKRLNEALDSGRMSYEAYTAALKKASETAEEMRLKQLAAQGGAVGFAAGMDLAAMATAKANDAAARGAKAWEYSMNAMDQAIASFSTGAEFNFQKVASGFVLMLAQMEARAAVSSIWGALGGASGIVGALGGIFSGGGYVPAVTSTTNTIPDIGTLIGGLNLPKYADGGNPPVGVPSLVGERGPELFVPKAAGTIVNNETLRGMGGSTSVVVQQTNHFGSDVSRAEMTRWAQVVEERARVGAIEGVIDERQRGGRMRRVFGR